MSVAGQLIAAIGRDEIADYVSALFLVYLILIFVRILLSWVETLGRGLPDYRAVRAFTEFVHQTVDPYLNLFRRILPPIGGGRIALDLSPIIAIILLFVVQAIVVGLIRG